MSVRQIQYVCVVLVAVGLLAMIESYGDQRTWRNEQQRAEYEEYAVDWEDEIWIPVGPAGADAPNSWFYESWDDPSIVMLETRDVEETAQMPVDEWQSYYVLRRERAK